MDHTLITSEHLAVKEGVLDSSELEEDLARFALFRRRNNEGSMRFIQQLSKWMVEGAQSATKSLEELAYQQGYRLDGMISELGCGARQLNRIFLRDIGLPPKRWLKEERMAVARRMLEAGDYPALVSAKLGFATPSNFGREFLASHGLSPGRYWESFRAKRSIIE